MTVARRRRRVRRRLAAGARSCRAAPPRAGGAAARRRRRILFPFVGGALSERALDAALRLARAEHATLVPAYLAPVPMALPLDAPLPSACGAAFELLEAIEQRAARGRRAGRRAHRAAAAPSATRCAS